MSNTTVTFLKNLARNLLQNRLDAVAEHFVFPLPFYAQDSLQVFGAKCTFIEVLQMYRNAALRDGVTEIVPRILAEGLPINGYRNLWVEWDHIDAAGTCLRTSQVHYVFSRTGGALFPKVEMIEYTAPAYPEVPASFSMGDIA